MAKMRIRQLSLSSASVIGSWRNSVAACRKSYTGKFLKPLLNNLL